MNDVISLNLSDFAEEAARCINCGYCGICPTFEVLLWETANPRGIVKLIKLYNDEENKEKVANVLFNSVFACTMCKACENICPVDLPLLDMWKAVRKEAFKRGKWNKRLTSLYNKLNETHNIFGSPPSERLAWAKEADIDLSSNLNKQSPLLFFVGCQASYASDMKNIAVSTVRILQTAKEDFTILGENEWCCGSPLLLGGAYEISRSIVEHNLESFQKLGVKEIVTTCASCYNVFANEYPKILGDRWNIKVTHITELINKYLKEGKIKLTKPLNKKLTYKDPCELVRHCNFSEPPREIINAIPNVRYEELTSNKEQALCCGGGGLLSVTNPKLVREVNSKLIDEILYSEADIVINTCPLCCHTIKNGLKSRKQEVESLDIVELIADLMEVK